ncbi:MAG: dTMP kinase [Rickettsiaceae bacterium]|nr:dTMP kinase [Rickettsiaceae bacterium]
MDYYVNKEKYKGPKFIVFEGIDGSGKTTQSKKLYQHCLLRDIDAIWTREIGGTDLGERIRDIVVFDKILPTTELLLILAARNEHIERVIKPALVEGKVVICDRFIDSTAAYQARSEADMNKIFHLNSVLFDGFLPDKTIYLKIDPENALKRAYERGEFNKYEMKGLAFFREIVMNYNALSMRFKDRIIEVDGSNNTEDVFEEILAKLDLGLL